MLRKLTDPSAVWLLVGLVLGVGATVFLQGPSSYATATDHSEEFAIATGLINSSLEGVYLLDFKAGSLLGTVMNQQNGEFQQFYKRDLTKDFVLNARSKPKFIMVTGLMEQARGAQVPINHVLYVAELNSGRLGAYVMPFRGNVVQGTFTDELKLVNMMSFRQGTPIRPQ